MKMTINLFHIKLERKIKVPLEIEPSNALPEYLKIKRRDKKNFSFQQKKILCACGTKGSMAWPACFHMLVGENEIRAGYVVV